MAEGAINIFETIGKSIFETYTLFTSGLPIFFQEFINLFLIVLLIVIYSIFVWKFYRSISTKNIIELDLNQYNRLQHPTLTKLLTGGLYFLEYMIILPILIFIWFSIFTILMIFLTDSLEISTLLIISATIIAAIRMTSYYEEELARDLAKLIPFTFLAVSILTPDFFSVERVFNQFSELPNLFSQIFIYLAFIITLEIILRLFDLIFSFFRLDEEKQVKERIEKEKSKLT